MIKNKHKIIVSVSGASGSIYAKVLFDKLVQLKEQIEVVGVLMSDNAKYVWETELDNSDYKIILLLFMIKWILWHLLQVVQLILVQ